jgi:protein ImuB
LLGDISGVLPLFGGESGLLTATSELLQSMGLCGRMAIADSLGAAWALSHHACSAAARISIAPPGRSLQAIEPLPVQSLRLPPATLATLSRLGIERVEQLLQLPRSGLASRLGSGLVHRIAQAAGQRDEPLAVYRAPAEDFAALSLQYPTSDQRILADRVARLTEKVSAGLAARQHGALQMECRLELAAHPPLTLQIGLFAPTIDTEHLSGLFLHQLEHRPLLSEVTRLTVSVLLSAPLRSVQAWLFEDPGREDPARHGVAPAVARSGSSLGRLIDSLSGRLGREAVLGVQIEEDPLPEKAFSVSPLAGGGARSSPTCTVNRVARKSPVSPAAGRRELASQDHAPRGEPVSHQPSPRDAMRRPLSLLPEPLPLAVALDAGPFHQYLPSPRLPHRLRLDGAAHVVVAQWGPERIETGWWLGAGIARDYYRIETDRGQWWWIFRNLVSKTRAAGQPPRYRWLLHGRFD